MATLQEPQQRQRTRSGPSITIALPPTPLRPNRMPSVPSLPPSPLLRTKTTFDSATGEATFVLPSVPTHEPEDADVALQSNYKNSPRSDFISLPTDITRQRSPAASSSVLDSDSVISDKDSSVYSRGSQFTPSGEDKGEGVNLAEGQSRHGLEGDERARQTEGDEDDEEEEEELLEELADEQEDELEVDLLSHQNDLNNLLMATQAAALSALQSILIQSRSQADSQTAHSPSSLYDDLQSAITSLSIADVKVQRQEALTKLNSLLDTLASDALVAGSSGSKTEGVGLLTVLGELLLSLDKVRPASAEPSPADVAHLLNQQQGRTRSSSVSTSATASSLGQEDPRNPFEESQHADETLSHLQRLLTALAAKSSFTSPGPSARASFQSNLSANLGSAGEYLSGTYPRRFGSLDIPHSHLRTGSSSSLGQVSHRSPSSLSLTSNSALRLNPDPEAWSHVNHIAHLTKDLVASRRGHQVDAGPSRSPMLNRMRQDSTSSSDNGLASESAIVSNADLRSGTLARRSFIQPCAPKAGILRRQGSMGSLTTSSLGSHSLPPRYSEEESRTHAGATEAQIRDYQARGLLPAYGDEKSGRLASPSSIQRTWPEKGILIKSSTPSLASEGSERTSSDFLALQNSLDRINASAPQLHNQRAMVDSVSQRSKAASSTGKDLNDLIEQLASSGKRLDDQRVEAPPCLPDKKSDSRRDFASSSNDEKAAASTSGTQKQSVLRKFSSAQLAGLRRATGGAVKGKEPSTSQVMQQVPSTQPVTFPSFSDSSRASATADAHTVSQKRGSSIRSRFFVNTLGEQKRAYSPKSSLRAAHSQDAATSSSHLEEKPSRSRYQEDNDFFDLLAASASRSRLADQEVTLRPGGSRRRNQSGSDLAESLVKQDSANKPHVAASSLDAALIDESAQSLASPAVGLDGGAENARTIGTSEESPSQDTNSGDDQTDMSGQSGDDKSREDFREGAGKGTHQSSKKLAAMLGS
ncbi:unnamed protein product [Sympodiomycopsis kandeliae]